MVDRLIFRLIVFLWVCVLALSGFGCYVYILTGVTPIVDRIFVVAFITGSVAGSLTFAAAMAHGDDNDQD